MKIRTFTLVKKVILFALLLGFGFSYGQIISYPYVEDFEFGPAGWSAQGTTTTWALGSPAKSLINYAPSGTNAWVTNLSADYLNFENGWVESPVFDFSSLSSPSISLSIFWNCEFSYDGAALQSSTDSGATWQNVGALGDPNNWYNDDTISGNPGGQQLGWTGIFGFNGSPGWVLASHGLSNLAGQSNVIFRMTFGSDFSVVGDGVAFDLVRIFNEDCYAGKDISWISCAGYNTGILDLNTLISADATPNGAWESENNLVTILANDEIDLSSITTAFDYNFIYTVNGSGACEDTAVITLETDVIEYAGEDSFDNFFCPNPGIVNLNNYLTISPSESGVWESLDGLFIDFDSDVVDLTGLPDGLYQFTYIVQTTFGYCNPDQADIQINIETPLSPGENGQLAACDTNFTESDLFNALRGNPDTGGFWLPSIDGYGTYTYEHGPGTYCDAVSAMVEVVPQTQLSAGTNGVFETCDGFAFMDDLFFALGGNPDPGGIWNPDPESNPGPGIYTYTHPATTCTVESSAEVEITISDAPDAGPDVDSAGADSGLQNLNDIREQFTGRSRDVVSRIDAGTWVQTGGNSVNISEDGEVDFPNNGAGAPDFYSFEYRVLGNCEDAVAFMTIEINGDDTPGSDAVLLICPGQAFTTFDMFNVLGGNPSTRGSFLEPLNGLGVYTYEIIDFEGNPGGQSTVTVEEEVKLSVGDGANNVRPLCSGATLSESELRFALAQFEVANPGGEWRDQNDAIVSFPITTEGGYRYTHPATNCFSESSNSVQVIIEEPVSAGTPQSNIPGICEPSAYSINLYTFLNNETPNGNWSEIDRVLIDPDRLAAQIDEDGDVDFPNTGAGQHTFRFRYTIENGCNSDFKDIEFDLEIPEDPGNDGLLEICPGTTVNETQLFEALEGSAVLGGDWSPSLAGAGVYLYTHTQGDPANGCKNTSSVTVTETANCDLQIKAFLQGAALSPNTGEESLMRDDLRVSGNLPLTTPYDDKISCDPSVFAISGADAIVDWVWVELREQNNNTIIFDSQSALLQRDGDVVDIDGLSPLTFGIPSGNYYVSINHRNHLGILSFNTIAFNGLPSIVNFSDGSVTTFGSYAQTTTGMPSNVFGLWAGDVNGDGVIQYAGAGVLDTPNLLAFILNDGTNFLNIPTWEVTSYNNYDVDMSGATQFAGAGTLDTPLILQNILSFQGNFLGLSTWQIVEQLPNN